MHLLLLQPRLAALDAEANLGAIERIVRSARGHLDPESLILLPEHFTPDPSTERYLSFLRRIAAIAGCAVAGGSHHRAEGDRRINYGCAVNREGEVIGEYSKLRPYFEEAKHVSPGSGFGEFSVNGWRILVFICADFWFSDLILAAQRQPDLILVPALSVSRKPEPHYSRALWRHLCVARAYEFGAYVAVSDWHEESTLPRHRTCGVTGLADPRAVDPEKFFLSAGGEEWVVFSLDRESLDNFRADRRMRGFFWKPEEPK